MLHIVNSSIVVKWLVPMFIAPANLVRHWGHKNLLPPNQAMEFQQRLALCADLPHCPPVHCVLVVVSGRTACCIL